MAPLYKRYIPPKPTTDSPAQAVRPAFTVESPAVDETPEKKRKRERTQEEVAERKAKKLKKKGVDPSTVQSASPVTQDVEHIVISRSGENGFNHQIEQQDAPDVTTPQAKGEFAHIKSDKKRHKLEKEARNARKAAEKAAKLSGANSEQDGTIALRHQDHDNGTVSLDSSSLIASAKATDQSSAVPAEQNTEKTKRKKRRKEETQNETAAPHSPDLQTQSRDPEHDHAPEDVTNDAVTRPKKRRHKLEGVLAESRPQGDVAAQEEADEEHLRNHSAVLDKFQKSVRRSQPSQHEEQFQKLPVHQVVQHLELPGPEQEPTPEFSSETATLPAWLAKPIVISNDSQGTFDDLNIRKQTVDKLSKLGFDKALPVQQGLIPLLLQPGIKGSKFPPGTEPILPDVAVSAPTGSGKTIAYLLPIIEAISRGPASNRLKALVVVPTRELVVQVAAVADSLTKGSGIRVGMATGTGRIAAEQEKLIKRGRRYDPEQHRILMERANRRFYPSDHELDDDDDTKAEQHIQDAVHCLAEHVPTYESATDLLVATPGRLLEHINSTLGFNLVHLQWLVIDEADKLLDHENDGFLEALNAELVRPRNEDEQDGREKFLRAQDLWDEQRERRLRKVVLSATMTRDISKLNSLKLRLPKMVIVRGTDDSIQASAGAFSTNSLDVHEIKETADGFELPRKLVEYCVPVGDGSEKPLVAIELLSSRVFREAASSSRIDGKSQEGADTDDDDSSSESDESSIVSSDDSSSSSDSNGFDEQSEISHDDSPEAEVNVPRPKRLLFRHILEDALEPTGPTVLVFTSSNESANRLSHLLKELKPHWNNCIITLTKSTPDKLRIRSKLHEPAIVISTDRAARGLDSFSDQKGNRRAVTHVIQYDVPRTLTSYIHRVGRTARAGSSGDAWTLFTHTEGRWFINEIAKAQNVKRFGEVERVKIFMADDNLRERYKEVLASMRDEVFGGGA